MTSPFLTALRDAQHPASSPPSRWFYLPYDQLSLTLEPLASCEPSSTGILLIESAAKGTRRPYHKQKLALLLTCMRHFAVEAAQRGYQVRYITTRDTYADALLRAHADLGVLYLDVMRPAEYELRQELAPLYDAQILRELPHDGWLTSKNLFIKSQGKRKSWLMNSFYAHVRAHHHILMDEDGDPLGGQLSFDADNRKPWRGEPEAPVPPRFEIDAITGEVGAFIDAHFSTHPGMLDLGAIPASRTQAEALLTWAMTQCMTHFGPYEDAMSTRSHALFHSMLSPLINLHRLTPREVLDAVLALDDIPIQSKEGFVRQLIGWREFMHHVHDLTDGLRKLPQARPAPNVTQDAGDAGWRAYTQNAWRADESWAGHGGAAPNVLCADTPLPPAFWGDESGMFCLDHVVKGVMETGWSHHIERLMVLANLATLLDVSPRQLTDWFWVAYIDAFDWVVEPNVLGMGTFGVGDLFTTKPYISGSNYINKMSDFCKECALSPGSTCPVTDLYWAFLARHEGELGDNPRMGLVFANLSRRTDTQHALSAELFTYVTDRLAAGKRLAAAEIEAIQKKHA